MMMMIMVYVRGDNSDDDDHSDVGDNSDDDDHGVSEW